jgi:hypothetical protein
VIPLTESPDTQAKGGFVVATRNDDRAILAGFYPDIEALKHGDLKIAAGLLRARAVGVSLALEHGPKYPLRLLADELGVSERGLTSRFSPRAALYAFPPPEFAKWAITARSWATVEQQNRPIFAAIDTNCQGRKLLTDLAELHRKHPELRSSDAFFLADLTAFVDQRVECASFRVRAWAAFFTEGIRDAIEVWSATPDASAMIIGDAIAALVNQTMLWVPERVERQTGGV